MKLLNLKHRNGEAKNNTKESVISKKHVFENKTIYFCSKIKKLYFCENKICYTFKPNKDATCS